MQIASTHQKPVMLSFQNALKASNKFCVMSALSPLQNMYWLNSGADSSSSSKRFSLYGFPHVYESALNGGAWSSGKV
jgi:hypothetical protein